ncbi:hypothetical protein BH09BAC5_BH09BAC5_07400 [soil metagenome]
MKIKLIVALICFPFLLNSQQYLVDSLLKILPEKCEDSVRYNRLMALAKYELYADAEKSMVYAREANQLAKKSGDDHKVGMSTVSIGNAFLLGMMIPDSAMNYYLRALELAKNTNDKIVEGNALNNLGNCYKLKNKLSDAKDYYEDALVVREQIKDSTGIAATLSNLGSVYQQRGDFKKAIEYYYRALPIKEREGNQNAIVSTLNNVANAYVDMNKPEMALEVLKRIQVLAREIGNNRSLALSYNTQGIAYFELQQYDKALECYTESAKLRAELKDTSGLAEAYNNIGNVYYTLKDKEKALFYYRKTIAFSKNANEGQGLEYLCNFAVGLSLAGKTDSAFIILEKASRLSDGIGSPFERLAVLGGYVEVCEIAGKYKEAFEYLKKRTALNDSLYKNESIEQLNELEIKYQSAKKQKEIEELQKKQEITEKNREREKLELYGMAGGTVLLLLVVVVVIRSNRQKKRANLLLGDQNKMIAEKNKDITDSINYALRIQKSVMPDERILQKSVADYFIFNQPRDIVSGDFYWLAQKEDCTYIAVADCTGHGVPGALVSVVGINLLNKIIESPGIPSPGQILDQLHSLVIHTLNKDADVRESKDGMDIGLVCIDKKRKKIIFSGAGRPMYLKDDSGLRLIKGDRYSVAGEKKEGENPFSEQTIELQGSISFYLSSDGFVDQFGETTGKKFLSKRFLELLLEINGLPMKEQQFRIEETFSRWKGALEQVDDVMVLGVQI